MPWKRPVSVPPGQVWLRFQGRERNGIPAKTYQIRDMDSKYRTQCIDLMLETFLRDEPLCQVLDIKSDPTSIQTIRANWESFLDYQVSLACFVEEQGEPQELVGFNIVYVRCRDDPKDDVDSVKGEQWKKLLRTLIAAEVLVDIFDHYGVDTFLTTSGLTVSVEHRGQNIGARLLEAREPLCRALGIKVISTVFTAVTSQTLATKCGYALLAELPYEKMLEQGIDLRGCSTPTAMLMAKRVE